MNGAFDRLPPSYHRLLEDHPPVDWAGTKPEGWPEELFIEVLCDQLGIPALAISADNVDLEDYARHQRRCSQFQYLPLFEEGVVLTVAMVEPWIESRVFELRTLSMKEVRVVAISERNFEDTLATMEGRLTRARRTAPPAQALAARPPLLSWPIDYLDNQNGFLRLASAIIDEAHIRGAADLHLEPQEDRLIVRFRIGSTLFPLPPLDQESSRKLIDAFKIKANIPIDETALEQRGRIREITSIGPLDLRVQLTPTIHGQMVVARLLDPRSIVSISGTLPFEGENLKKIQHHIEAFNGMVLVTGPTGSGKSTTLLRMITTLDRVGLKIITIEEPVEYSLPGIVQTDVSNGKMTYASASKAALRNDPDAIMVGEIRDLETAKAAINASLTGHLVFSTLHTNNTSLTVNRLLTLGCDAEEIRSSLACVIAQRLVDRLCKCKSMVPTPEKVRGLYKAYRMGEAPPEVAVKNGCPECKHRGVAGRLPVFEVLSMDDETRALIVPLGEKGFDAMRFRKIWLGRGGVTLGMHALNLVGLGLVDPGDIDSLTGEVFDLSAPAAEEVSVR